MKQAPAQNNSSAQRTPVKNLEAQVYFVRHGDTDLNSTSGEPERFRAWGNPPLNEKGFESAHDAGTFLADKHISHIFHTDLTRGAQTAEVLRAHTGAELTPVHGLRPWNMGDLTGKPVDQSNLKMVAKYQDETPDKALPGGESFHDFQSRWHTTLSALVDHSKQAKQPIAVVTHTRNLNDLKHTVTGQKMELKSMQPPGGIVRMDVGEGRVHLADEDTKEGLRDDHKPQE